MKKYNDCNFLAQATVNSNTVILVQDTTTGRYYSYWGVSDYKSRVEIKTPSGRKPSKATAIKKFLEMVEAAKYLTFDNL